MRLVVDMNLSPGWVGYLVAAGHEAVHWSEVGPGDAPDEVVLAWAATNGYVILTSDLDFGAILASTRGHGPSVVQLRSDTLAHGAIGNAVLRAIALAAGDLSRGALLSIEPGRARIRLLPFPPCEPA